MHCTNVHKRNRSLCTFGESARIHVHCVVTAVVYAAVHFFHYINAINVCSILCTIARVLLDILEMPLQSVYWSLIVIVVVVAVIANATVFFSFHFYVYRLRFLIRHNGV